MKTVLIVENDRNILDLLATTLSDYLDLLTVKKATNGIEAYKILHEQKVDLMITDLVMPLLDGCELIQYMKNFRPNIPIVAISGHVSKIEMLKQQHSCCHYFLKPFRLDDFADAVLEKLNLIPVCLPFSA